MAFLSICFSFILNVLCLMKKGERIEEILYVIVCTFIFFRSVVSVVLHTAFNYFFFFCKERTILFSLARVVAPLLRLVTDRTT
jgi:hypothetical protein